MIQFLVSLVLAALSFGKGQSGNASGFSGLGFGPAHTAIGSSADSGRSVSISPGSKIQDVVDANPPATTFVLQAGVYRMQSVTPKNSDIFEGRPGAVLNGARQLSSITRSGSYWVASGQSQHGTANGRCLSGYRGCEYPEDLFFNNVPLLRVEALVDVTAGKWYFDYSAAKVYFVDDPTGKTVEISVTTHAFSGTARNVTIKGLTIEKYAVPAQDGPVSCYGTTNVCLGTGWTIESNEIRLNHGAAIRLAPNQVIRSNYIHHNGQEGLTGSGSNVLIQDNEIAYNNTLGFDFGWEAGGTKFSNMTNLVVQGNYVHDNKGPGISLDYQCYNWTIQGNRTSGNYVAGILDEISYDGTARYNIIENDASYPSQTNPSMWYGCGIAVSASQNAQVYGNTLINNTNGICAISNSRGSGNRGAFEVHNLSAHDNVIIQSVGSASGAVASSGYYTNVYSSSWNNHWTSDTYKLSNSLAYTWMGGATYVNMTSAQWQSFGQDTTGTWISPTDSSFPSIKFTANQTVQTVSSTQVWSLPTISSTLVTTEASGTQGTVTQVAGPIRTGGMWWWSVKYNDGKEGWSEETFLQ
jgi:Right handed beta helix region